MMRARAQAFSQQWLLIHGEEKIPFSFDFDIEKFTFRS